MYVKYLNGLFGEILQGMRFKDLDFEAQRWRFYEQIWFFVTEGILSASFSFSFYGIFIFQILPLFIGKRFGNKSWLGL